MTKKDYELFAFEINRQVLREIPIEHINNMINLCSNVFMQDNSLFNRDKFERACYEGKHIRKSISGKV